MFLKKKYDKVKDNLYLIFDYEEERYYFYKAGEKVDEDKLNKKTLKELKKANQELIDDPNIIENYRRLSKRFDRTELIKSKGISINDSFGCLEIPKGFMSEEVANYLNNVTSDDNFLIGIRRLNLNGQQVANELQNGLLLMGDFVVVNNDPDIERSVSFYSDNKDIIKEAVGISEYKNYTGAFIIKIPINEIGDNLYYRDESGNKRLKPEYIDAYLQYGVDKCLDTLVLNNYAKNVERKIETSLPHQDNYGVLDVVLEDELFPNKHLR